MKRHEKRLNDVLLPAVLLRELTVVLAALLFLPLLALAQGTQPQLQITSPSDGTLIAPGQTITIVATLSQGTSFAVGVVIVGEDPLGTSGLLTNAPYQFSLTIPNNSRPGGYQIVALGCTTPGVIVASSPVTIDVERPGAPVQLLAEPSQIQFESQGQQVPVRVTAKFSDGTMADVTRSSNLTFSSSNATVATVSPTGLVSGVSAGSASITAAYGQGAQSVRVSIPLAVPPPVLTPSPVSLSFGAQGIGTTSQAQMLTLTNTSNGALRIINIAPRGDFSETDNCVSSSPLAVGNNCTVNVTFTPASTGLRDGTLTITNTFNIVPMAILLTGTGAGDLTPPVTTAVASPVPNAAGWNNTNVTVALNSTDSEPGGTGVKQIQWSLAGAQAGTSTVSGSATTVTVSAEGITILTYFGTDNAGNVEAPNTLTIKLDKTPPTITPARTPAPNTNGWNNTSVTVSFQCADSLSGLAAGSPPTPTTLSAEGPNQSVIGTCTDIAGNSASATVSGINIDKTPPTVTPTRTPAPNANGWNNTNVTVSFQCADSLSGLAAGSPPAPTILSTDGANQSVTGTCTDLAGNSASATVSGINIDKTPPTVACSASPSTLWPPNNKLAPVNASVTVTDSLSGSAGFNLVSVTSNEPDSGQGDIQGFVPGTPSTSGQLRAQRLGSGTGRIYTFNYSGTDRAGNAASCTTTVTVPHDQGK